MAKENLKNEFWAIIIFIGVLILGNFLDKDFRNTLYTLMLIGYVLWVIPQLAKWLEKKYEILKNSSLFDCRFQKRIEYIDEEQETDFVLLETRARIKLPFAPYLGLYVTAILPKDGCDEDYEFGSGKISEIFWENTSQQFLCCVEPLHLQDRALLGKILHAHISHGWEIGIFDETGKEALAEYIKVKSSG